MTNGTIKLHLFVSVCLLYDRASAFRPRIFKADGTEVNYFTDIKILYGNPLELYCIGQAYRELMMCKDNVMFYTKTVNETTVRLFDERPEIRRSFVYCHYVKGLDNTNIAAVRVLVDMLPQAANFHCNSNLKHHNCSWSSPNLIIYRFSLYHVKNNVYSLICNVMQYESMHCSWGSRVSETEKRWAKTISFQMETCNHFGCINQTFHVNRLAVIKSEPPEHLTIVWKRSHSASLSWKIPENLELSELHVDHKISYWHSGAQPRYVNTSSVFKQENYLGLLLELPCPDTFYEVKVSIKPHEAGEEYWSDDAVISVVTDAEPAGDVTVDPSCHSQPKVKINPDVMLYKIEQFKERITNEQSQFKERIRALKLKVEN